MFRAGRCWRQAETGHGSLLRAVVAELDGSLSPLKLRKVRESLLRKYAVI